MAIRQAVRSNQTLTPEVLESYIRDQIIPFATASERDTYFSSHPGQVIWSFEGPASSFTGNDRGWFTQAADDPDFRVRYQGVDYQIRTIRWYFGSSGLSTGGLRFAVDPEFPGNLPAHTEMRVWALDNPGYILRYQFRLGEPYAPSRAGRMRTGTTWDFLYSRGNVVQAWPQKEDISATRRYRIEIRTPDTTIRPVHGQMVITLDDDAWWMWTGQRWRELVAPPPQQRLFSPPRPGILAERAPGWEYLPQTIGSREYTRYVQAGRWPLDIHPFDTQLATETPVEFNDHIVHIVTDDRTVTVKHACTLQFAAVGRGANGGVYQSAFRRGVGGGAGSVVLMTYPVLPGDTVRTNGPDGEVYVNGELIIDAFPGQRGAGNIGFGNRGGTFVDPIYQPPTFQDGGVGIRILGNNRSTDRTGRGAGAGGEDGSAAIIPWIRGGFLVAEGGYPAAAGAGAGRAGLYPGSGGGGTGLLAIGTVKPVTPALAGGITGFDDGTRLMTWVLINPPGTPLNMQCDQFRWRYVGHALFSPSTTDVDNAVLSAWSDWSNTNTGSYVVPSRFSSVILQWQGRVASTTAESDPSLRSVEAAEGNIPSGLNIRFAFNPDNPTTLRYTLQAAAVGYLAPTQGFRHRWREETGSWSAWDPSATTYDPPASPNITKSYTVTIDETTQSVTVEMFAANGNGAAPETSTGFTATWERPVGPVTPVEPDPTLLPPEVAPNIVIGFNELNSRATVTWEDPDQRATGYRRRFYWLYRDGSQITDPTDITESATDLNQGWINEGASTSREVPVNTVNIAQLTVEVESYNDEGESPIGTATRSFSAPVGPVTPTPIAAPTTPVVLITYTPGGANLSAAWSSTGALEYRHRFDITRTSETVGSWSDWGTETSGTLAIGSDFTSVKVVVEARNRDAANAYQSSSQGEATQAISAAAATTNPPARPSVSISYVDRASSFSAIWSAARATEYRYRRDITRNNGNTSTGAWSTWGTAITNTWTIDADHASVVIRVEARNRRTATATDYQTSPQGSATQVFVQEPVGPPTPPPTILAPPTPSITFGAYTGNQLAVSWTNVRADATRSRIVQINDKNQSDIGAWSTWGTTTTRSVTVLSDTLQVRVEVQARNGTAPSYNVVDVRRTWTKPIAGEPPPAPTISVTSVSRSAVGLVEIIRGNINIRSAGATQTRYRIKRTSTNAILVDWVDWAATDVFRNVTLRGYGITIEGQARNGTTQADESSITSFDWTPYGGVGTIDVTLTPNHVRKSMSIGWEDSADQAVQWRWAIQDDRGGYSYSAWTPNTLAIVPLADSTTSMTVRVQGRKSSLFLPRQGQDTWNRSVTPDPEGPQPPTGPTAVAPSNVVVRMQIFGRTWSSSWTADGTLPITYTYRLTYTIDGRPQQGTLQSAGGTRNAAGSVPRNCSNIHILVTAINSRGQATGNADASIAVTPDPEITRITYAPFGGNRLDRSGSVTVTTRNATAVRIRLESLATRWLVGSSWKSWSRYVNVDSNGQYTWTIPLFWTGAGRRITIAVEATRASKTVTSTVQTGLLNLPVVLPQIDLSDDAYRIVDPNGALPFIAAGIVGTLITGGVATAALAGSGVISGFVTSAGTLAGTGVTLGSGAVSVYAIITIGGPGIYAVTTTAGLVAIFGAAGISGAAIGLSGRFQGGPQRNLVVKAVFDNTNEYRVRVGWRLLGFPDSYSAWTSWKAPTNSNRNENVFRNIAGGDGGMVVEWQARNQDGATTIAVGFRFTGPPVAVAGSPSYNSSSRQVTVSAYGMTHLSYRFDSTGALTRTASTKSGRIGRVTVTAPRGATVMQFIMEGPTQNSPSLSTVLAARSEQAPIENTYAEAPAPNVPPPTSEEHPGPEAQPQQRNFAGEPPKPGVILVRHSAPGRPFVPARF